MVPSAKDTHHIQSEFDFWIICTKKGYVFLLNQLKDTAYPVYSMRKLSRKRKNRIARLNRERSE